MNLSDLVMTFFKPSSYQGQPSGTPDSDDTIDWTKWQKQFNASRAAQTNTNPAEMSANDISRIDSRDWQRTPDKKLPAYNPTNSTEVNQRGAGGWQ